jgi:hypothetical protein
VKVEYSRNAQDEQLAVRLWVISKQVTGVCFPALVGDR